jgi:hypothetical protein
MRNHLGFGIVLAAASLAVSVDVAYGQSRGGGAAVNANNVGAAVNTAVTGSPAMPGQTGGIGGNAAVPGNVPVPGMAGTMADPSGVTGAAPANAATPGVMQGTYPGSATGVTPGYTSRIMPGMQGYNAVNPMATTMAPSYYYAGTAGMPAATYGTQTGPYVVQRRGLFGRRNRVVYPASPYGYSTYGTTPGGYSPYQATTYYTRPNVYTYGSPVYTTPGVYGNGAYPY